MSKFAGNRYVFGAVMLFDALALGIVYYLIPYVRRPFDVMMATIAVVCLPTIAVLRNSLAKNTLIVVASLCVTFFALEMAQKYFDLTEVIVHSRTVGNPDRDDSDHWNVHDPITYFAARDKAIARAKARGEDFTPYELRKRDDIFAGVDKSRLVVETVRSPGRTIHQVGTHPFRTNGPPYGYINTPNNVMRLYVTARRDDRLLFEALYRIDEHGQRTTRDRPDAGEAYLFFGCSFTFGFGLDDDETVAHHFSAAHGFDKRVVNFAVCGYGPHQCLREMELSSMMAAEKIDPATVKGVYYGLIDDHPNRAFAPSHLTEPYYALEGDIAVYKGLFGDNLNRHRLELMMDRSRIYPVVKERLIRRGLLERDGYRWRLTHGILKEIDRRCRERFGVGLTVIYWGNLPEVEDTLRANNIRVVPVADAFGANWRDELVKYNLPDTHPSAYANRILGRHLAELSKRDK